MHVEALFAVLLHALSFSCTWHCLCQRTTGLELIPCLRSCRWRAYFTSGSSAAYLFMYSLFYFYTKLDITKVVPMVMYFSYMLVISYAFFCLTGTIGFYATYVFVRRIFASVKID